MYTSDNRIVITLDAGGTNFVFSAMQACRFIVPPVTMPSNAHDLGLCLDTMVRGFSQVIDALGGRAPVAISFAFPGPADYPRGIIGGFLPNFPSFRDGVALGPFLEERFSLPVFINNDGDLFAFGEALCGVLPDVNRRIREAGGARECTNLLGYTFGTGLGIGSVVNGRLNLGNNSCVETFCLPNKHHPDLIAEEGCSIRAVKREYARLSGDTRPLEPYGIFRIAEGLDRGDRDAARRSFELFGEVAGDVFATAVSLTDSLVVVGGGVVGAAKYIMPALLREMRSQLATASGAPVGRVQMKVYNLDDPAEFQAFIAGDSRSIRVPGSSRTVAYDPQKRTGVMVSRLGASQAISVGAYAYALSQIDAIR